MTTPNDDATNPTGPKNEAWFKLRYAVEKGAAAFTNFIKIMNDAALAEKERLAQANQDAQERAAELEEEYQAWKAAKEAEEATS